MATYLGPATPSDGWLETRRSAKGVDKKGGCSIQDGRLRVSVRRAVFYPRNCTIQVCALAVIETLAFTLRAAASMQ
jgi:hypothetical protein